MRKKENCAKWGHWKKGKCRAFGDCNNIEHCYYYKHITKWGKIVRFFKEL